jgi:hypothetical protein
MALTLTLALASMCRMRCLKEKEKLSKAISTEPLEFYPTIPMGFPELILRFMELILMRPGSLLRLNPSKTTSTVKLAKKRKQRSL